MWNTFVVPLCMEYSSTYRPTSQHPKPNSYNYPLISVSQRIFSSLSVSLLLVLRFLHKKYKNFTTLSFILHPTNTSFLILQLALSGSGTQ